MSYDNSMYDGVEFVAHDLDTMRKQYERLRYGHAVTLRKLDALRNEVKAWREWHNKEQEIFVEEPLLYQAAINASRNTDTLKALEDER